MINNKAELILSCNALNDLEEALLALKASIEPKNPALFVSMAESYYKNIICIRKEIDLYLSTLNINKSKELFNDRKETIKNRIRSN